MMTYGEIEKLRIDIEKLLAEAEHSPCCRALLLQVLTLIANGGHQNETKRSS